MAQKLSMQVKTQKAISLRQIMKGLANIISASRGIVALAMLAVPVFSVPFWMLYVWGGVSDMIDGPIARRLHSESELGSRIDSISDLVFLVCAAVKLLPSVNLPLWIWLWIAGIGMAKLAVIISVWIRNNHFYIEHSRVNKLTGLLLFLLPFALQWVDALIPAMVVCAVATIASFIEIGSNHGHD